MIIEQTTQTIVEEINGTDRNYKINKVDNYINKIIAIKSYFYLVHYS